MSDRRKRLLKLYHAKASHPAFASLRSPRFVAGHGSCWYPSVMFVGEAPGAQEDLHLVPFVGPAGGLLRGAMAADGLDENNCWITNSINYRPPANRTPTPEEVRAAVSFMRREMAIVGPEVVVPLGRVALQTVLPRERRGITSMHATTVAEGRWLVVPMLHPAAVLRGGFMKPSEWVQGFDEIMEALG
jgi:uracil-DNA glycosylase